MSKKTYILYDGRAVSGNPDDACVIDTANSEADARDAGSTTWAGHDAI